MNETSRNSFALRSELKPHNKKEIYAQSSVIPDWLTAQHSASFVQSGVPLLHMKKENTLENTRERHQIVPHGNGKGEINPN